MFKGNKGAKPARKPGGGAALMQQVIIEDFRLRKQKKC